MIKQLHKNSMIIQLITAGNVFGLHLCHAKTGLFNVFLFALLEACILCHGLQNCWVFFYVYTLNRDCSIHRVSTSQTDMGTKPKVTKPKRSRSFDQITKLKPKPKL